MATFNKFDKFLLNVFKKVMNFNSDQLKLALTATANAPGATNNQLSDLTEIAYTNLSSRNVTTSSCTQTSGTLKVVVADLTLTASGGSVAAFQYIVMYDDTAANDELCSYWNYGSAVTLADTETFLNDFDGSAGLFSAV